MFKPKEMIRIIIIGPKQSLEPTITRLHVSKLLHIIDFADPDKDFKRGQSLENASEMSDLLVKLRSISSILKLGDELKKIETSKEGGEEGNLREKIFALELSINESVFAKREVEDALRNTQAKMDVYKLFAALDLPFERYSGYRSLITFTGTVKQGLDDIEKVTAEYELFCRENMIALFVPLGEKDKIDDYLSKKGFFPLEPPENQGNPIERLKELELHVEKLKRKLEEVNERLVGEKKKHARFIIQVEGNLAIQVEKAEAPLMFAYTEHSFIIDGWIPKESYFELKKILDEVEGLHVDKVESECEEPPVLLDNPRPSKPFEMLVHLYSTPSYRETDPTLIISLIFPLFFGFMIGDAGFGLLMIGLGYYMSRKLAKTLDMPTVRELGLILVLGGVFSIIFGLFLFGEFFAIPFHSSPEAKIDVGSWSEYLGLDIPLHPVIHKIEDLKDLLVISIIAAGFHLGIGYAVGIRNELHDRRHVLAKFGWLMILFAILLEIMIAVKETRVGGFVVETFFSYTLPFVVNLGRIPISMISVVMIIAGIAMFLPAEGALAVPEIIGLVSNVLSYARLAGIAVAKAAIALGVTMILLLVLHSKNIIFVVFGGFLVLILYGMVFILGMIAAAIQALRLNYVEFFRKFYEGNGSPFQPFGTPKKRGS